MIFFAFVQTSGLQWFSPSSPLSESSCFWLRLFTICKSNNSGYGLNRNGDGEMEYGNLKLSLRFMSLPMNYIEIIKSECDWSPTRIYHFSYIDFIIERDPPVDRGHLQQEAILSLKRRFADLQVETGKEKEWDESNVPAGVGSDVTTIFQILLTHQCLSVL